MGFSLTDFSPKIQAQLVKPKLDQLAAIGEIVSVKVSYPEWMGSEDEMQMEIFKWIRANEEACPSLKTAFHTPNGVKKSKACAVIFSSWGK